MNKFFPLADWAVVNKFFPWAGLGGEQVLPVDNLELSLYLLTLYYPGRPGASDAILVCLGEIVQSGRGGEGVVWGGFIIRYGEEPSSSCVSETTGGLVFLFSELLELVLACAVYWCAATRGDQ